MILKFNANYQSASYIVSSSSGIRIMVDIMGIDEIRPICVLNRVEQARP